MKISSTLTLLLTAAAFSITPAFAGLLIYEPFDYTPGSPIIGQTDLVTSATAIWYQAGTSATSVHQVATDSLSAPSYAPFVKANKGHTTGVDYSEYGRMSLGTEYSADLTPGYTLYYSLLLNIPNTAGLTVANSNVNANNDGIIAFNNITGPQANHVSLWAGELVIRQGVAAGTFNLGVRATTTAGGTTFFTGDLNTNQTYFVVVEYQAGNFSGSGGGGTNSVWIDPDTNTLGAANAPTPDGQTIGQFNKTASADHADSLLLGAGISAGACPDTNYVDEIRVGTTWADVTSTNIPVTITSQPRNTRALVGSQATFSVSTVFASTFQWQFNGSPIAGATQSSLTLNNIQFSDAGTYNVVVGNPPSTPVTSSNATLSVFPDTYPRLIPLWSLAPGSRPYLTTDAGGTPNQRCIAFNALSNQVLIVSRTNTDTGSTNPAIYVLNADTGADLYEMNVDPFVVSGGLNNNSLSLNYIDVADDGGVIAGNVGDNTTANFNLYYWTSSSSNSAAGPFEVWSGDPSGQGGQRFGDYFAVRGAGANTQVLLDSQNGGWGALLMPTAGFNITDLDSWSGDGAGGYAFFNNVVGGLTGSRTLIFNDSSGSTFWEKHGGGAFNLVGFDATSTNGSVVLTNYPNITGSPSQVAWDAQTNILVAIILGSDPNAPDTLAQYDISADPTEPLFVKSYNFPVNHQANNNGCGRVIFAGDRVYALDSNNGMAAWTLEPVLHITPVPPNQVLSWSAETTGYTLVATPSLTPPVTWTNVSTGTLVGSQYFVTNSPGAGTLFYRLQK